MKSDLENDALPRMSSILGANAVVIGNATGQGDLDIRGRVQGDILLKGRALISEGGVVLGRVEALSVVVAGQVRGDITAHDEIQIHPTGDVEGNISAPRVSILAGARVLGSLRSGDTRARAPAASTRQHSTATSGSDGAPDVNAPSAAVPVHAAVPEDAASLPEGEAQPSLAAPLPLPVPRHSAPRRGKPKTIPSFQKGSRAELKDAE